MTPWYSPATDQNGDRLASPTPGNKPGRRSGRARCQSRSVTGLALFAIGCLLGWGPLRECFGAENTPVTGGLHGAPIEERYMENVPVESLPPQGPGLRSDQVIESPESPGAGIEPVPSVDGLFGLEAQPRPGAASEPESTAALFGIEQPRETPRLWSGKITGFFQAELAYTYPEPDHLSKAKNILRLQTQGRLTDRIKWQASGHFQYDAVFDLDNFYPPNVEDDQEFEAYFHETFFDISAGAFDLRLGRQQVIWGESVGLFFADVVSALDLREVVLPDFDLIRIPQWAARAEYFQGDFHAEALWIPVMTYNEIGEAGAEFFPFPPPPPAGFAAVFDKENKPSDSLEHSAGGVRFSFLKDGWDPALFYYTSMDRDPAFERRVVLSPQPAFIFTPIHKRIHQAGATLGKDVGPAVFTAEVVYTVDKLFSVVRTSDSDGLVKQDVLDYILGLDYVYGQHSLNFQFFQRYFPDHDADMMPSEVESGLTFRVATDALHPDIEPEVLWIFGLNEQDWLLQPKITWTPHPNFRAVLGADIFEGPSDSLLGQFDAKDRVYVEVRYTF